MRSPEGPIKRDSSPTAFSARCSPPARRSRPTSRRRRSAPMNAKSIATKMILGVSGMVLAAGLALVPEAIHAQGSSNSRQFGSQFPGQLPGMDAEGAADAGYLGLSMQEVNAGNAKELK